MSTVIFTKGLPASGKSTWAKEWVRQHPNRIRINRDDLRAMMRTTAKEGYGTGCESLVMAAALNILENALRLDRDVVLDNTNMNQTSVKAQLEVCERHGAKVEWRTFYTDPQVCIRRDSERENPVGAEIIMTMYTKHKKELTPPR